jgi:hypothetical protein
VALPVVRDRFEHAAHDVIDGTGELLDRTGPRELGVGGSQDDLRSPTLVTLRGSCYR